MVVAKPRVLNLQQLSFLNGTGTRLVLKKDPNDPTPVDLGVIVSAPSLPRWMSSEFTKALQEHLQSTPAPIPDADLNLYSHDWIETITYIANDDLQKYADKTTEIENLQQSLLHSVSDHPLSTGCSTVVPRTRIRKISIDSEAGSRVEGTVPFSAGDNDIFYAVASSFEKTPPDIDTHVREITIAALADRPNFVKDTMHIDALADCFRLRQKKVLEEGMSQRREAALNAASTFPGAP